MRRISGGDSHRYNAVGELDSLRYDYSSSRLLEQTLIRDDLGRITTLHEYAFGVTRTLGYRYDLAGRLYAVTTDGDTTAKYGYDDNGNRLTFLNPTNGDTASATYDQQDRMLRYKNTAYTYSAAGELQQKTEGANTTSYAYDPLGNLNRVQFPAGDTLTYAVDGANRRVGRRGNGRWSGGWLYQNELQVVAELDSLGVVKNRYVWGAEGHVPALLTRGSTTYRLITDYLGSVRAVVNTSTGAIVQRRDYDAWGVAGKDSNAAFQSLGYAGGLTDTTTGLVRFGARDYDPTTGRWTAKDPIGFGGRSANLFVYVADCPTVAVDPTGLTDSESIEYRNERGPYCPAAFEGEETVHWLFRNLKHGPLAGQVRGRQPDEWLGDYINGEGGFGRGEPTPPKPFDVDAIYLDGRWYKIFGPVTVHDDGTITHKWYFQAPRPLNAKEIAYWKGKFKKAALP